VEVLSYNKRNDVVLPGLYIQRNAIYSVLLIPLPRNIYLWKLLSKRITRPPHEWHVWHRQAEGNRSERTCLRISSLTIHILCPFRVPSNLIQSLSSSMSSTANVRRPFVGGNWKAYNDPEKVSTLVNELSNVAISDEVEVLIAPTYIYLDRVNAALGKRFNVSAQDCAATDDGAYTGDISAKGLFDFGIKWVIIGHSERRKLHNETNSIVGAKVTKALNSGLKVVACIGETLEERKSGQLNAVLSGQMEAIVKGVNESKDGAANWAKVVIAYEPVWAIGTGVVASPAEAEDAHKFVRNWLASATSSEIAASTRIIYGGSVKPDNARELFTQPNIDGFLVGGASLVGKSFEAICNATVSTSKL